MSFSLTWYGHAAFLVKVDNYRILIDPYFSGNPQSPVKPGDVTADFIFWSHMGMETTWVIQWRLPNEPGQLSSATLKSVPGCVEKG